MKTLRRSRAEGRDKVKEFPWNNFFRDGSDNRNKPFALDNGYNDDDEFHMEIAASMNCDKVCKQNK